MLPDTRTRFELIIDRGEILRGLSYIKFLQNNQLSFSLKWREDTGLSQEGQQPDVEALLAVATVLRFFTQPSGSYRLYIGSECREKRHNG